MTPEQQKTLDELRRCREQIKGFSPEQPISEASGIPEPLASYLSTFANAQEMTVGDRASNLDGEIQTLALF